MKINTFFVLSLFTFSLDTKKVVWFWSKHWSLNRTDFRIHTPHRRPQINEPAIKISFKNKTLFESVATTSHLGVFIYRRKTFPIEGESNWWMGRFYMPPSYYYDIIHILRSTNFANGREYYYFFHSLLLIIYFYLFTRNNIFSEPIFSLCLGFHLI